MRPTEIGTEFDFGGVKERVVTRDDFPFDRARRVLHGQIIAVIGYGVQGPAQSLNLKESGFDVVVGQRRGLSFDKAEADGWKPGETLLSIEEAAAKGDQVQYLLSDAGQKELWPTIRPLLKPGNTLYFSHGFSHVFREQTTVIPPDYVDVILVAPKGAGRSVRQHFLAGRGINSSFAVAQDYSGQALERALATGMGIGSGFLFPTTFENEVHSDLTGERGMLMGGVWGLCQAGYNNLRVLGFSPRDAAGYTVEMTTHTISKIIGEKGADGLLQEIPEDLLPYFSSSFVAANEAVKPVFEGLYERVVRGDEAAIVLEANSKPDYRDRLNDELRLMGELEIGRAATEVREARLQKPVPDRIVDRYSAIIAGALIGSFHAQYELFIRKGHSPSEAFNETVEEATQSLYPLIDERGFPWMYANCSTTAQRGALDWNGRFREVLEPRLRAVYSGELIPVEGVRAYIIESPMWRAGAQVRNLRPESQRL